MRNCNISAPRGSYCRVGEITESHRSQLDVYHIEYHCIGYSIIIINVDLINA